MKYNNEDTPPSSVNGDDEISVNDDTDEVIYLDEMEEVTFEEMEEMMEAEGDYEDIEPPEDLSALVFNKHVGSVFCCDLHPNGKLAVTGGEDDKAYVWSVDTGEIVMRCESHKDSVIFVGFSFDGAYLATADISGVIKVWKCCEGKDTWSIAFEYEADDLTWGLWHFKARVLIVGAASGDIYVFKIPSGETKILQGHNCKTDCGKLFPDGTRLTAGYEDGAVKIWDLKTSTVLHQVPSSVHDSRVIFVDTHPENNLVASISADGKVVLMTSSNGKIVGQIDTDSDLEVVSFPQDAQLGYFALGNLNGDVSIWEVAKQMLRHHCSKNDDEESIGVTKMFWVKNYLVTGCLDGSIRIYEGRSGAKSLSLTGHRSEILDLCYNDKKNILLSTSDDGTARIFKYEVNKEKD